MNRNNWVTVVSPAIDDATCRALADRLETRGEKYRRPYNDVFGGARFELAGARPLKVYCAVDDHLLRPKPTAEDLIYDVKTGGQLIDFKVSWDDFGGVKSLQVHTKSLNPNVAYVYGIRTTPLKRMYKCKDEPPIDLSFAILGWQLGSSKLFKPVMWNGREYMRCERQDLRPFSELLALVEAGRASLGVQHVMSEPADGDDELPSFGGPTGKGGF